MSASALVPARVAASLATFTLVTAACGGSPAPDTSLVLLENRAADTPAPTPPPQIPEPPELRSDRETLELAVRIVDDMARAAAGAAGNCGVAATAIDSLVAANAEVWIELAAIAADDEREVVLVEAADRIDGSVSRLADGLGGCVTDMGVRHSLEAMAFTRAPGR